MADATSILLGLKSPGNYSAGTAQTAYTPQVKRNNATVGSLQHFLGLKDDGGETSEMDLRGAYDEVVAEKAAEQERSARAAAYSKQVEGEYGLEVAREKSRSDRAIADAVAERAQQQRDFQAQQNQMTRDAVTGRQQSTQAATTARTAMGQRGIDQRLAMSNAEKQASNYETKYPNGQYKSVAPRPAGEGLWGRLVSGPSQQTLQQQQAAKIRQQAMQQATSDGGVSDIAQQYANQYSGLSPESLMAIIQQTQPDADEGEQAALLNEILSLQEPQ